MTATTKIETMDSAAATRVRKALEIVLSSAVADSNLKAMGISARLGRATYDPDGGIVTFKLEVGLLNADGKAATKESASWDAGFVNLTGLRLSDLGKTFTSQGKAFTITGANPRARKWPVLAESGGRTYKFKVEAVLRGLGRPESAARMASHGYVTDDDVPACERRGKEG